MSRLECGLQVAKNAARTWDGNGHGSKFAQHLLPFLD
jgi:hypothetical protein